MSSYDGEADDGGEDEPGDCSTANGAQADEPSSYVASPAALKLRQRGNEVCLTPDKRFLSLIWLVDS
jgi:hypothetical protein